MSPGVDIGIHLKAVQEKGKNNGNRGMRKE
jgi:hypothetical protein